MNVTNAPLHVSHCELACRARDDYEVLQLPPGCTLAALKRRYREMAVALHPDKCLVSIPVMLAEPVPEELAVGLSDVGSPSMTCVLGCHHAETHHARHMLRILGPCHMLSFCLCVEGCHNVYAGSERDGCFPAADDSLSKYTEIPGVSLACAVTGTTLILGRQIFFERFLWSGLS